MSRALVTIHGAIERNRVAALAMRVPTGTRVEFKAAKRSVPQNDRMWVMLTEISRQLSWHGHKMTPPQWKLFFLDALNTEAFMVPSHDGCHMVNVGRASSDLSKSEFGDLLEIIAAFGAEHGVLFHDG